jgi:hypothetical protein
MATVQEEMDFSIVKEIFVVIMEYQVYYDGIMHKNWRVVKFLILTENIW